MPTMTLQQARGRVVPGHDQNVRIEISDLWHGCVEFFDSRDLRRKVAVFSGRVRVLEVKEEKVTGRPFAAQSGYLIAQCLAGIRDAHAHKFGQSAIHWINR